MDKKKKTTLIIAGIAEVVIVVFCLVVSILVISRIHEKPADNIAQNGPFIGWLQNNSTYYFLIFVLPMFLILAADVVYLILYATKKESTLSDDERDMIEELAKKQAREEVLKELAAQMAKEMAEEKKGE